MEREGETLRKLVTDAARGAQEFGQRREDTFPIRPRTAVDLNLRDSGIINDITGIPLVGIDLFT